MERRQALKNIGLSFGSITMSSGIISIIQSCQSNESFTDLKFFGGSEEDLNVASFLTKIPILRKDFIIDEFQVIESKSFGADVILLIAAILNKNKIKKLPLSNNKKKCLISLLENYHLVSKIKLNENSFEKVNKDLTQIFGIGRWTAEMFSIFYLGLPDIMPLGDLGFINAYKKYYNDIKNGTHPHDKTVRPQILKKSMNIEYFSIINNFYKLGRFCNIKCRNIIHVCLNIN